MKQSDIPSISPVWEKMRIASTIIASLLIPLVIAFVSQSYTTAMKQNEISVRYVEIAISILKSPPDPATDSLRNWAIDVINHHSEVPLTSQALIEMQKQNLSELFKALNSIPKHDDKAMSEIRNIRS